MEEKKFVGGRSQKGGDVGRGEVVDTFEIPAPQSMPAITLIFLVVHFQEAEEGR